VAVQTKPKITSLIPNPANLAVGMTAANQILHNLFCFMHFHAQIMHILRSEKAAMQNLCSRFRVLWGQNGSGCICCSQLVKFAGFYLKRLYNIHTPLYDIFEPQGGKRSLSAGNNQGLL
jgi:hypothetical protein